MLLVVQNQLTKKGNTRWFHKMRYPFKINSIYFTSASSGVKKRTYFNMFLFAPLPTSQQLFKAECGSRYCNLPSFIGWWWLNNWKRVPNTSFTIEFTTVPCTCTWDSSVSAKPLWTQDKVTFNINKLLCKVKHCT
jgi:hypothetical protein